MIRSLFRRRATAAHPPIGATTPVALRGGGEHDVSLADLLMPRDQYDAIDFTAVDFERTLAARAPVWETAFAAGPGLVVSVSDAALVLAQYVHTAGRPR